MIGNQNDTTQTTAKLRSIPYLGSLAIFIKRTSYFTGFTVTLVLVAILMT